MTSHRDFEGERQTVKKKKKLKSPFFWILLVRKPLLDKKRRSLQTNFEHLGMANVLIMGVYVCVFKKRKNTICISQWNNDEAEGKQVAFRQTVSLLS